MKLKRSVYNLIAGFIGQAMAICLGLVIPRLFIVNLGSDANGLVSSVNNIFIYFMLLETGVGMATTQALYKPIANSNKDDINAILAATDKYYKRTGIVYTLGVIIIAICYPLFVKTSIDRTSIFFVIIFQGLTGVINYFFYGKYRLLLAAEGKEYVFTNLTTIFHVFVNISKIILLLIGCNVVQVQAMYFVFEVFKSIYIYWYIKRKYKWIDLKVKPNTKAISQKNSVLVHQITGMIFNNTDTLLLTTFCNLKIVSVYSMYNLFCTMVDTFMTTISSGFSFQLGQIYAIDKKRFVDMYDIYENYYTAINFSINTVLLVFMTPFLTIYTRDITDVNYISAIYPVLFILKNLMTNVKNPSNQAIVISQHFKQTRNRAIIEALINLVISLLLVKKLGIVGVLIGTIVAMVYRFNDMIIYSNKVVMNRLPIKTYARILVDVGFMAAIVLISNKIGFVYDSYIKLIIGAGIHLVICALIFFGVNSIVDYKSFKHVLNFIKNRIKQKS